MTDNEGLVLENFEMRSVYMLNAPLMARYASAHSKPQDTRIAPKIIQRPQQCLYSHSSPRSIYANGCWKSLSDQSRLLGGRAKYGHKENARGICNDDSRSEEAFVQQLPVAENPKSTAT